MSKKILIVEDEADLQRLLSYNLTKEGYRVVLASDGEEGLRLFQIERPDLVILDVMLPKLDGFEVCKMVRRESTVPILMLTAKKEEVDRVLGLELGADDYVTKPFGVRELLARVKAILRRTSAAVSGQDISSLHVGRLEVDFEQYEVRVADHVVPLSIKEFDLLKCLLKGKGKALTRDELLEKVWGVDRSMNLDTRTVDQHIARLRTKLGKEAKRILTVKGVGYRFKLDESA